MKKRYLFEKDPYSINPTFDAERRLNNVRNTCVRADKSYHYEYSKELFLIEPHYSDLYIQN